MSEPWLILDVSALAYRALYAIGGLSHQGIETGAVFGFFRSVMDLMELHQTRRVAFAFDRGYGKRLEIDKSYKSNRGKKELTEEELDVHRSMRLQVYRLRTDYLPKIGFKNLLWRDDYEADDVIAQVCLDLPKDQETVIVSGDHDLFQLLTDRVSMWLPGKNQPYTKEHFVKQWGIGPEQFADVLAMAGCPGDGVIGIHGIGFKRAVAFLSGTLKPASKAYEAIVRDDKIWRMNLPLVRLPFPGIGSFELQEDGELDWQPTLDRLGMKTLGRRVGMV